MALQILPADALGTPSASTITYDALDLMWMDGLEDMRALLALASPVHEAPKAPEKWRFQTMESLQWYCSWEGLAPNKQFFDQAPMVSTSELLLHLGVPPEQISSITTRVTTAELPRLQRLVLSGFAQQAVELMADQLPHLDLIHKFHESLLFAG